MKKRWHTDEYLTARAEMMRALSPTPIGVHMSGHRNFASRARAIAGNTADYHERTALAGFDDAPARDPYAAPKIVWRSGGHDAGCEMHVGVAVRCSPNEIHDVGGVRIRLLAFAGRRRGLHVWRATTEIEPTEPTEAA